MGLCCSKSDELSAAHGTGAAPCALTAASYAPPESRFRASVESHERILQSADKYGPGASRLVADVLDAQPRASEPGKYGRTIPSPPEPSQLHNGDGAPESMPPELSASSQIALKLELVARIATGTEVSSQLALLDLSLIHISEPTRLLSISYAVFCLKKKKKKKIKKKKKM
eukprot:TRINITY_DN10915_c0_g1_i1.p1 TRINITY_DN10915_c0_g1~~TRINITY_DN10915_c0_g1_i1.p1  ORF type:complete len:171 (+),score=59.49 TRINITY_DN10915_c0_g1_i1:252-764(+)